MGAIISKYKVIRLFADWKRLNHVPVYICKWSIKVFLWLGIFLPFDRFTVTCVLIWESPSWTPPPIPQRSPRVIHRSMSPTTPPTHRSARSSRPPTSAISTWGKIHSLLDDWHMNHQDWASLCRTLF